MVDPILQDYEEYADALGAHKQYNPKTGKCYGGDSWCTELYLPAMKPMASGGAAFLWPAYLGARLWIAAWVAVPALFGYRFRVVVTDGKARSRLVRVGKEHDMAHGHAAGTPVATPTVKLTEKTATPAAPTKAKAKAAPTAKVTVATKRR